MEVFWRRKIWKEKEQTRAEGRVESYSLFKRFQVNRSHLWCWEAAIWSSIKWQESKTNSFNNQKLFYFIILNEASHGLPCRAIPHNNSRLQPSMIMCNTLMKKHWAWRGEHTETGLQESTQLWLCPCRRPSLANSNWWKGFKCCRVELVSLQPTEGTWDPKAQQRIPRDKQHITAS